MIPIPSEFTAPLPASGDPADASLVEVERLRDALEAWSRSIKGKTDDESDRIADLDTRFEEFMGKIPARTLAGVAPSVAALLRIANASHIPCRGE